MAQATMEVLRLNADDLPAEKPKIADTVAVEIALLVQSNIEPSTRHS